MKIIKRNLSTESSRAFWAACERSAELVGVVGPRRLHATCHWAVQTEL